MNILKGCKKFISTLVDDFDTENKYKVCWVYGAPVYEDRKLVCEELKMLSMRYCGTLVLYRGLQ